EKFEAAVKALNGKVPLNKSLLGRDTSASTRAIIEAATGFAATGKQLVSAAEHRGGYGTLLTRLDLRPVRADSVWNRTSIVQCIQELHRRGLPLNSNALRESSAEVEEALKGIVGIDTTGGA